MNDGSTDLKKFNDIKHFELSAKIKNAINDVTPAMRTFRAEQRYSTRYWVLERVTNWKPIIQADWGRVTAVTIGSSRCLWFGFFFLELHYLFDNTSILELHSCILRVNSGINLFSLSIHIGTTLKQFCVVRHCVRQCVIARAWSVWLKSQFCEFYA